MVTSHGKITVFQSVQHIKTLHAQLAHLAVMMMLKGLIREQPASQLLAECENQVVPIHLHLVILEERQTILRTSRAAN